MIFRARSISCGYVVENGIPVPVELGWALALAVWVPSALRVKAMTALLRQNVIPSLLAAASNQTLCKKQGARD